jgi:hypothetical protein
MRNIRDYKAKVRPDSLSLGSASPFNIVTEAFTLNNFSKEEIALLYRQHTDETGQAFDDDAVELVWEQTQGQPWLVNAVAREAIAKILQSDYTKPVTAALVSEAIQNIILRRDTHIDSLLERLKEERVRKVIEPVILGDSFIDRESDDFLYAKDLGLIRVDSSVVKPANPIYAEVIIRKLSSSQERLRNLKHPYQTPRYLKDGRIDMNHLMRDFQLHWRENSAIWLKQPDNNSHRMSPYFTMKEFLERIIQDGRQINSEIRSSRDCLDFCLKYEKQKYPIKLTIRSEQKSLQAGLEQTARYMDTCGCSEGWLAIFDRNPDAKWDDKIYTKKEVVDGKTITVVGL